MLSAARVSIVLLIGETRLKSHKDKALNRLDGLEIFSYEYS